MASALSSWRAEAESQLEKRPSSMLSTAHGACAAGAGAGASPDVVEADADRLVAGSMGHKA